MLRQAAWNEGGLCAFSILSLAQEKQTSPLSFVQHKQTHSEESGGGPGSLHMSPKPRIRRIPGRKKLRASATIFRLVSETKIAKRYFASGMVQGVGYRFFTQRAAEQLKVSGFVRNLWDGRVEVFAMGTTEQHKELRRQLERGPFGSDVTEVREEPATIESQYENMFVINPSA